MKVTFAQPDFPFAERTVPLVRRAASKLGMARTLGGVVIDILDFGARTPRNPADSIEVYANGGVRLHLRFDHFLKARYRDDPRKRQGGLPLRAFDPQSAFEVLCRLLLQWRDVQDWGIPENQDEEFLCLWNAHVAGRLERMGAPCASKVAHWEEFLRVFAKGEYVAPFLVLFEMLWKCDDLGKWGLDDVLYRIRSSRQYRPFALQAKATAS